MGFKSLLNKTCDIYRYREVVTPNRETTMKDEKVNYSPVKCRIAKKSLKSNQTDAQNSVNEIYVMYFLKHTDVKTGDNIVLEGKKYQIGVLFDNGHHIEVEATYKGEA